MRAWTFFLLIFSFSIANLFAKPSDDELICKVQDGKFIVINHQGKSLERFVQSGVKFIYKCEKNIAAALIGNFFVVSNGEKIVVRRFETKVSHAEEALIVGESVAGSYQNSHLATSNGEEISYYVFPSSLTLNTSYTLKASKNLLGGMVGKVFVVSDGKVIKRKFFEKLNIARNTSLQVTTDKNIVGVLFSSYLITSDGKGLTYHRTDSSQKEDKLVSSEGIAAAFIGNEFLASNGSRVEKITSQDKGKVPTLLQGDHHVVMGYRDPYLIIVDQTRFRVQSFYINDPNGSLTIKEKIAFYITENYIYHYSVKSGKMDRTHLSNLGFKN